MPAGAAGDAIEGHWRNYCELEPRSHKNILSVVSLRTEDRGLTTEDNILMSMPSSDRRVYGHYDVESTLGRGAMGMVYLARDRRIGRKVALKTVQIDSAFEDDSTSTEFFKRLQREAELSGSLQHPNIVTLYEAGYEDERVTYLATEYIDGETLKERLKRSKPLPVAVALSIAADILRGLAFAHARGIVHRDIKPANILLTRDGQAKIADFGIARPQNSTLTSAGALLGTPNYMSPEQVKAAPVSPRSDLFSVGVVLYELLAGVKPFAADDLSGILQKVLHHDPEPPHRINPEVSEEISSFVAHLFAKDPAQRFPSAEAALAELTKLRSKYASDEPPTSISLDHSATMRPSEWSAPTLEGDLSDVTPMFLRHVPSSAAWMILISIVAGVVGIYLVTRREVQKQPAAHMTQQQLAETTAKRNALANARRLLDERRYDESIRAYDNYLAVYPSSAAAREGREEAIRARDEAKTGKPQARVTVTKPKKEPPKEEPPKPPSFRERLRRLFRRDKPASAATTTTGH